jgi:hypothetical protein
MQNSAAALGSILVSSGIAKSERRQMRESWMKYRKRKIKELKEKRQKEQK